MGFGVVFISSTYHIIAIAGEVFLCGCSHSLGVSLGELEQTFQSDVYRMLSVADTRRWKSAVVTTEELTAVVELETSWAVACPELAGAGHTFHLAKETFIRSAQDIQTHSAAVSFWRMICADAAMPSPLRHYAGCILLACSSSSDAERSISVLNSIVTTLRNRLTWQSVKERLVAKEDAPALSEFPVDAIVKVWRRKQRRRRIRTSARATRSDSGQARASRPVSHECVQSDDVKQILALPSTPSECCSDISDSTTTSSFSDSSSTSSNTPPPKRRALMTGKPSAVVVAPTATRRPKSG